MTTRAAFIAVGEVNSVSSDIKLLRQQLAMPTGRAPVLPPLPELTRAFGVDGKREFPSLQELGDMINRVVYQLQPAPAQTPNTGETTVEGDLNGDSEGKKLPRFTYSFYLTAGSMTPMVRLIKAIMQVKKLSDTVAEKNYYLQALNDAAKCPYFQDCVTFRAAFGDLDQRVTFRSHSVMFDVFDRWAVMKGERGRNILKGDDEADNGNGPNIYDYIANAAPRSRARAPMTIRSQTALTKGGAGRPPNPFANLPDMLIIDVIETMSSFDTLVTLELLDRLRASCGMSHALVNLASIAIKNAGS